MLTCNLQCPHIEIAAYLRWLPVCFGMSCIDLLQAKAKTPIPPRFHKTCRSATTNTIIMSTCFHFLSLARACQLCEK